MCVKSGLCVAFPDTCMTPGVAAGAPGPITYPNNADPVDGRGATNVKVMNSAALRKDDQLQKSMGDNAGTSPGGVASGVFMGVCKVMTGSPNVKFEGKEAAYHTCVTAHNGHSANAPPGTHACPTNTQVKVVGAPGMPGGPGGPHPNPVDAAASVLRCSELAQAQIEQLRAQGWNIRFSTPADGAAHPDGSWCDRSRNEIVIGASSVNNPNAITQILSHEMGHALHPRGTDMGIFNTAFTPDPPGSPTAGQMSRADFMRRATQEDGGRDEGAATLNNDRVRQQVQNDANCGQDIGLAGAEAAEYERIARGPGTDDQKMREIGEVFRRGEVQSTNGESYGRAWSRYWYSWVQANPGLFY